MDALSMQIFTHRITDFPGGDKSFVELPFTAGPEVERIEVSYAFPTGAAGSVIDIGLAHRGRSRGWTGSEYGHIWVAEDRASAGYHPGPLQGDWHVVLGIVRLGPAPFVDLTIRLIPRRDAWLAGELHSHTEHSDGGVLVAEAIARARNSGCEFVALTDHNATAQNRIRPDDPAILVLPGMELTSYWGHSNFHGLDDPVVDWRCYTPEDVPRKMAEARERGATVGINHPFQNSAGGRWQVGFGVPFDFYEIWNGSWAVHNEQALAHWQALLCEGRRIAVSGGSDFHLKNRRRHGRPANRLHVQTRSVAGILDAVRAGANVVCAAPDEAMVTPLPGTPMFGGTLAAGAGVGLRFTGLAAGDEIRLITESGVVRRSAAQGPVAEIEAAAGRMFLRAELWQADQPRLFSNPFYVG
jgi:hypothetical protein